MSLVLVVVSDRKVIWPHKLHQLPLVELYFTSTHASLQSEKDMVRW